MRVLDTRTGQFVEIDPKKKKYAILSHTWDRELGEQTYQELREIQRQYDAPESDSESDSPPSDDSHDSSPPHSNARARSSPVSERGGPPLSRIWGDPKLSPKIREACRIARKNGYHYIWIDSCCIDKTSSSEFSEAINSMYQWYARAHVCYAFLPDVPAEENHWREKSSFRRSRWFKRGWTLQELIAPLNVQFLSTDWKFIGSKESLADLVVEITCINHHALLNVEPLEEFSVAQRLSWAAERETTREEDRAYSLLGIFNINMPTLYGEGRGALRRLQEEIMRRTPDQSLFAWTLCGLPDPSSRLYEPDAIESNPGRHGAVELEDMSSTFLASSLELFGDCTDITALSHDEVARRLQLPPDELSAIDYAFTPYGIRTQLPVISFSDYFPPGYITDNSDIPLSQWYLVILGCGHKRFPGHLLARVCYMEGFGSSIESSWTGQIKLNQHDFDLLPLSPATITRLRVSQRKIPIKTLYIPQPERDGVKPTRRKRHATIKLALPEKSHEALSAQGYTATLRSPSRAHSRTHSVTLSHNTHTITIDYQHTLEKRDRGNQKLSIEARVKTSGPGLQTDGVRTRVSLEDRTPWEKELDFEDVKLDVGSPVELTLKLGLTFAKANYYLLFIKLSTPNSS